ncbi:MAG: hypothetical protein ACPGPF_06265 [Pontibacterium sp.]
MTHTVQMVVRKARNAIWFHHVELNDAPAYMRFGDSVVASAQILSV